MIRINLLPDGKKKQARAAAVPAGSSQGWLIAYLVVSVGWCVGLALLYMSFSNRLEEQQQQNSTLQGEITRLREKSAGLEEVQAKIARSQQLEQAVQGLLKARQGPTRVMMEVSQILSSDGGPTIDPQALEECRRTNPLCGFNRGWDPKRLWLTSFEEENRECEINGMGKTNEDVAEFIRRLTLSEVFEEVTLDSTRAVVDEETELQFIGFNLTCKVKY
jgi:type IV pilus assembly protein PilN